MAAPATELASLPMKQNSGLRRRKQPDARLRCDRHASETDGQLCGPGTAGLDYLQPDGKYGYPSTGMVDVATQNILADSLMNTGPQSILEKPLKSTSQAPIRSAAAISSASAA
ncbi:MAG: hypothetical protein U0903_05000 [Planctomycetales bacterium]